MFSTPRTEIAYCNAPFSKFNPNLELYKYRYARAISNGYNGNKLCGERKNEIRDQHATSWSLLVPTSERHTLATDKLFNVGNKEAIRRRANASPNTTLQRVEWAAQRVS